MPIVKLTTATTAFAGAHDFEVRRRGGGGTKYPRGHSTMAQNLKERRTYD